MYEELSRDFSRQAMAMQPGKWRDRFLFAVKTSLRVLQPHRTTLRALIPVLIGDPDDGVFAEGTAFSRVRVQQVFDAGTDVAVLIRHVGFWSLNGARVLYQVGGTDGQDSFGFAYGTLANHAESGEELFEVSIDRQSGDVMYRIRAVSRPQSALTWIGQPVVCLLQARFRLDSAVAMHRAIGVRA